MTTPKYLQKGSRISQCCEWSSICFLKSGQDSESSRHFRVLSVFPQHIPFPCTLLDAVLNEIRHAKCLEECLLLLLIILIVSIYFWKVEVDLQTYWLVERVGKYNGMKRLQIFEWWFQSSAFFRVSDKSYVLMQKTKAKKQTNKRTWKKNQIRAMYSFEHLV